MAAPHRAVSAGGCDHIGLCTADAERLVDFYRQAFGLEVTREEVLPPSLAEAVFGVPDRCRFVKMAPPPRAGASGEPPVITVELFQPLGMPLPRRDPLGVGVNHWGLRVGDRQRAAEALSARGVTVIEVARGGRPIFFVRDPDGNLIELRE